MRKKLLSILLILIMSFSAVAVKAINNTQLNLVIKETALSMHKNIAEPNVGSIGGEWLILGLARSGIEIDNEYFSDYYKRVEEYVKINSGILHKKKYTEYSRVILALTAIGKNPMNVAGYNLLIPLGDFEKTIWQGINGAIWALIALDSGNYDIPINHNANIHSTREMYINHILDNQTSDGGWALSGDVADVDVTAMALVALSKYRYLDRVNESIEKALKLLINSQNENGGFSNMGASNCESSAQVLTALCALGIKYDDLRFVKNRKTVLDDIMTYYSDNSFKHILNGEKNQMSTEQAFYSLVALWRFENNLPFLYSMSDAIKTADDKNEEKQNLNSLIKSFDDVLNHKNKEAIENLAGKGILNGKSENIFAPENTMTRAEFATVIVKALKLDSKNVAPFEDVKKEDWFYTYVNAAYENAIINGVSETLFNPYGTITRQEAGVMICRCGKFLGFNTDIELMYARDILAGFIDYVKASPWAIKELAFCIDKGIMDNSDIELFPHQNVKRGEVAQMIFNLLRKAEKM